MCGGVLRLYPQLRCFAACSGFHIDVSLQDTAHLTHDTVHLTPHPIRPPSGNMCGVLRICPQLRCSAACSGFHIDVSLQDTAHLTHAIAHLHMAQCISHMTQPSPIAPPMFRDAGPTVRNPLQAAKQRSCGHSKPPISPYVPRRGTDRPKPTASCEAALLWV